MHPVANALFTASWTAGVTITGAVAAKLRRDYDIALRFERLWARGLLRAWGVEVEVTGAELDADSRCIVMANHQSHVDVPILFMALPFVPGFLAKKELAKIPILSLALRAGRHVLIDRSDQGSALQALKSSAAEIRAGKTIVVFPEGTRGDGETLGPFKKGGFLIAKRAQVPIVPVAITGTRDVLERGSWFPRAGAVRVRIGEPIPPADIKGMNTNQLRDMIRERIRDLLDDAPPPSTQRSTVQIRTSA